jgi:hypothetical protein
MKCRLLFVLLMTPVYLLRAQSMAPTSTALPTAQPAPSQDSWMVSFLTPDQRVEYAQAHAKALADDPALKKEGDDLKQQGVTVLSSGTPAEKQHFLEMMTSHRQKLRAAMLKEDPKLGPIFAEIDRKLSEAKAKGAAPSAHP